MHQCTLFYKEICAKYVGKQASMIRGFIKRLNRTVSWKVIHLLSNKTDSSPECYSQFVDAWVNGFIEAKEETWG